MHACMTETKAARRRKTGGQWLKTWRKKKKLPSFQAAAKVLGVPWHRYRRWEIGQCVPNMDACLMLSKETGCPITIWAGRS